MASRMIKAAKYSIGQVVKHRVYPFRGVIFESKFITTKRKGRKSGLK